LPRPHASQQMKQPSLSTSKHAADLLGISPERVRALARDLGIGQRIGRDWVFTEEDVERLRQRPIGTPGRKPRKPND
jgi:hypothetical protein